MSLYGSLEEVIRGRVFETRFEFVKEDWKEFRKELCAVETESKMDKLTAYIKNGLSYFLLPIFAPASYVSSFDRLSRYCEARNGYVLFNNSC